MPGERQLTCTVGVDGKSIYTRGVVSGAEMEKTIQVRAFWDEDAKVWVAESDDVPGLVTEAESVDRLVEKLKVLIPELLAENGIARTGDIPFRLVSEIEVVSHQRAA
jgi:predicted RNase H-like HicB family nuclease